MKSYFMRALNFLLVLFLFCIRANDLRGEVLFAEQEHNSIECDKLGNVYLISDFEILKYNAGGKLLTRYSNKSYGKISALDVTNPLKILVFYKDFSLVLFLNNMLDIQGDPIAFETLGMPMVTFACTGFDNSIWIYDSDAFELKRLNAEMTISGRSGNLFTILKKEVKPIFIQEHLNQLYMLANDSSLYVFDAFGSFVKTWKMQCTGTTRIAKQTVYQCCQSSLVSFHTDKLFSDTIEMNIPSLKHFALGEGSLFLGNGKKVFKLSR
ncbi:MAG: hypothetical protein ACK5CV_04865 [Bacteroidota bacterium]